MPDEGASSDGAQLGVQESLAELKAMITTWDAALATRLDASDAALATRLDASDAALATRLDASDTALAGLKQQMVQMTTRLDASDAALAGLTLQMANCMDRLAGVEESFFVRFDCKFGLLLGEHGGVKSMDDMIALFSEDDDKAISLLLLLTDLDQQQGFRDEGEGDARVTRVTLSEIERTDGDEEMPAGMRVRRRLRRQVAR